MKNDNQGWAIYRQVLLFAGVAMMTLLLAACGPSVEPAAETVVESAEVMLPTAEVEVLPAATETVVEVEAYPAEESYPAPTVMALPEESYPAVPPTETPPGEYPPAAEVFQEPRFRIDGPVRAGDSTISGQAPPDMELAIVDVTFNGALLGTGRSQSDGQFSIDVSGLNEGNRIGITFGALEEGLSIGDMSIKYFPHRGEGFMNLPNVGIMLDTLLVEP